MSEKPSAPKSPADVEAMSFEAALKALEEIVHKLESGEASLEDSIEMYARGAALRQHCELKLRAAQARIEAIAKAPDGSIVAGPLDID